MKLNGFTILVGMYLLGAPMLPAEEPEPITFKQLAPLLLKLAEPVEYQSLAPDHLGQAAPISTTDSGVPLRSIIIPMNAELGISFRDQRGDNYAFCYAQVPDLRVLAKAKTMNQVLNTLMPPTKKNLKSCKQFKNINHIDDVAMELAYKGPFRPRINIVYFDQKRLIGIKCEVFYRGSETARTLDSKIDRLTIECWVSADLSEWK